MTQPFILIAEDDDEDRMIIQDSFKDLYTTYKLEFVHNGVKVLERLNGMPAAALPTLIILDLNMPLMNGTETLRMLKEKNGVRAYSHYYIFNLC